MASSSKSWCTSNVNKVINMIFADNDPAKDNESDEDGLFEYNIENVKVSWFVSCSFASRSSI